MSLLDDVLKAAAETPVPFLDVDVEAGGRLLPLRFYRIDGGKWAEITALCPARLGSAIDRRYGYNFQAASQMAAPVSGRVLDGDDEVEYDDEKWREIINALAGAHVKSIHSAIWQLNEYDPQVAVVDAKKALTTDSEPKPA